MPLKPVPTLAPLCALPLMAVSLANAASPLPPPAQIKPKPVLITKDYTEGVVVDREGNLYFSHGKVVTRISADGKNSTWAETGAPNGHKILSNGEHLVCDSSRHAVLRLDADGKVLKEAAVGKSGDLDIRTPNDLTLTPEGGFYFTDSEPKTGAVHYVAPDGTMKPVARKLNFPNGIVLSPDGKKLYIAESRENRVLVLPLLAPGEPDGEPRVFSNLPKNKKKPGWGDNQPDGMAMDAEGRLWVAHFGMKALQVLSTKGKLLATYDGGNRTTSNVCFAGKNHATVYATGGEPGGVFRLDVNVPGLKLLK